MNANIAARLSERAANHPQRTAIVEGKREGTRRVTFGELSERVARLAAGLEARGLKPGDSVLLFIPMSIDLYTALIAVFHLGAVAVFVDAWAGRARLDSAVRAARPRAFLGTPRAHLLRLTSGAMRAIPTALVVHPRWLPLERLAAPQRAREAAVLDADAPALITFTTGSTGRPKAAVRTHGFLWAQHLALAAHLGLTTEDVDMPTLPVFVLNNLACGVTSVIPNFDPRRPAEIDPARVYRQMVDERVTTSTGSPAFYERLAAWCAGRGLKLPLRALFTGGAPVPPPLARLLADTVTGHAHVLYGSTEAEPIAGIEARAMLAAMSVPGGGGMEGLCVGRPVPEIAVRLIRPHDGPVVLGDRGWGEWDVAPVEVGEVVVSGDHVLPGYLDDPEGERANKIRDGARVWHRTGDAARLDTEGRLWLMGRIAQRVRRAGEVWWSVPAEARALAVAGVSHAAYLGIPDPTLGERAVLCVEVTGGRLPPNAGEALRAALAPMPLDELRPLARIPRDPRHRSKTDTVGLRALLDAMPENRVSG